MEEAGVNLGLDIEAGEGKKAEATAARVCLLTATGYTRDGGTPTLSARCTSYAELELEVERLRGELDKVLTLARARLGDGRAASGPPASAPEREAPPGAKARIDSDLRVADVMTRDVTTVDPNEALSVVDELMKVGHFRHMVVVDDEGTVAGVVSRRDLFYGALAWSLGQGTTAHERSLEAFPAKQVMKGEPVVISPAARLADAASLMREHQIGCLPVVEDGKLVGILTEGDFLALLV